MTKLPFFTIIDLQNPERIIYSLAMIGSNFFVIEFMKRVWVEIDLDCITENISEIRKILPDPRIIAVVKANGYGHGALEVAQHFESIGVDFFAVSSLREAMDLRNGGINGKILILGFTSPDEAGVLTDNGFSQTVYSYEYAKALSSALGGKELDIHIKLNTGMNRLGFDCCDADPIDEIENTLGLTGLRFEGIFTHFASADFDGDDSGEFTKLQYSRFINVSDRLESDGFHPVLRHCCNSAATLFYPEFGLDAVRLGIIIYGLTPSADLKLPCKLRPAMTFKAVVSMIHTVKKGQTLSYGRTHKAERDMTAATVTVGYADGYPRFMSDKGEVLIGGKRCKILGRVCMDQMIVDISGVENVKSGDEVVLFGRQGDEFIPVEEIAEFGGTINYEIVCGISRRVPRYYLKNGKKITVHDYLLGEDD